MKTYISALLLAGATLTAVSCDRNNDTQIVNDQDTIALVTETTVSFFSKGNGYQVSVPFQKNIPTGIMYLFTGWKMFEWTKCLAVDSKNILCIQCRWNNQQTKLILILISV